MGARKDDKGKPPLSLIPRSALLAEARVMAHGKAKYGAQNWRSGNGMEWSRVIDAALRHLVAFADGEDFDNGEGGSGELHLANARCCMAFLIEYYENKLGVDDRHKRTKPEETKLWQVAVVARNSGEKLVLSVHHDHTIATQTAHSFHSKTWPFSAYQLVIEEASNDEHTKSA